MSAVFNNRLLFFDAKARRREENFILVPKLCLGIHERVALLPRVWEQGHIKTPSPYQGEGWGGVLLYAVQATSLPPPPAPPCQGES